MRRFYLVEARCAIAGTKQLYLLTLKVTARQRVSFDCSV
jgi:hypothetical protein